MSSAYMALFKSQEEYEHAYSDRQRFIRWTFLKFFENLFPIFSENILTTTIFLKDLTKEVNTQELTYSAWALLCELNVIYFKKNSQLYIKYIFRWHRRHVGIVSGRKCSDCNWIVLVVLLCAIHGRRRGTRLRCGNVIFIWIIMTFVNHSTKRNCFSITE
jgi:hypothetical protein